MNSTNIAYAADRLGGDVTSATNVLCPGPGHSRRDRSLSVTFAPDGTFIAHSFAGDDFRVCRDHVTILAGKPKLGKSWLALGFGVAVASGTPALGVECEQGDVLYLALEDNRRRLQDRLRVILPKLKSMRPNLSRLHLQTEAPKLDAGLVQMLAEWRDRVPDPRLIIIDTLAMVRPPVKGNQGAYASDYEAISPLQKFAMEHRIGVVVVTHVRKGDTPLAKLDRLRESTLNAVAVHHCARKARHLRCFGERDHPVVIVGNLHFSLQGIDTVNRGG